MMLASTKRWATVAFVMSLSAAAQSKEPKQTISPLPRFEDYPVTDIFHGTPAAPHLTTPTEQMYRTVIREGVAKGIGVLRDGKEQVGPNFAGHYIVITWGCGSPCGMMAIEDALTGKLYDPPLSENFHTPWLQIPGFMLSVAEIDFRVDSDLMIVKANPDPSKERSNYTHYFLWKNDHWACYSAFR
jgi:hypothetical protein